MSVKVLGDVQSLAEGFSPIHHIGFPCKFKKGCTSSNPGMMRKPLGAPGLKCSCFLASHLHANPYKQEHTEGGLALI